MLSDSDIEFCNNVGLEEGTDIDTCDPQLTHICWPYFTNKGTLCKSKTLWSSWPGISNESKPQVDCKFCIKELKQLRSLKDGYTELFDTIGKLSSSVNSLKEIEFAAHDYIWSLNNQELAKRYGSDGIYSFLPRLKNALDAEQKRWEKSFEEQNKKKFVCDKCNDTHWMYFEEIGRKVMCTQCPIPCQECRFCGTGSYCEITPCDCVCHK